MKGLGQWSTDSIKVEGKDGRARWHVSQGTKISVYEKRGVLMWKWQWEQGDHEHHFWRCGDRSQVIILWVLA